MDRFIDDHVVHLLKPRFVNRQDIVEFYCRVRFKKDSCPKSHGGNCMACVPGLHTVLSLEDANSLRDPRAFLLKRLSDLALDRLSYWFSDPKKPPLGYHQYIDPLEDVQELFKR